jgi:peptide/nickel transport system substrate-binding protein
MKAPCSLPNRWGARFLVTLALGLLLAGAPTVLAGTPHAATTPKLGGNVTWRLDGPPDCLDAATAGLGFHYAVNYDVWDTLLSFDDKGRVVPYLAQKYTVSKNGKTVTFYLRHDVKFSNGNPLTAASVKAEFDRILNPATKSTHTSQLSVVTSMDIPSKYVLRFHLSAPFRPLLTNLAFTYLGIPDPKSVAAAGNNHCNDFVGSGAYKITSVGPAYATIKEVRNPLHRFGPSWAHNKGPAYLSSVTFVPIVSNTTAVSELLAGQIDITDVPGTELSRVQGNGNFKLYRLLSQSESFLLFNTTRPPFDNVAVRRAVAEAIDRKALVTSALNGLGKVSTSILPPNDFAYDPASTRYAPKLNLAAARAAIAAANATGHYTLLTTNAFGFDTAAELIQGELGQVGMQTNIVIKGVVDWLAQLAKGDFDMGLLTFGNPDPDLLYRLFNSSQRNGGYNYMNVNDPALDRVTLAGRTAPNLKKAKADYYAAQKMIDTKVYADPLWVPITVYAVRSRVRGWHLSSIGYPQFQDMWVK